MSPIETAREILLAIVVCALVALFHLITSNIIASLLAAGLTVGYVMMHLNDAIIGMIDEFLSIFIRDVK